MTPRQKNHQKQGNCDGQLFLKVWKLTNDTFSDSKKQGLEIHIEGGHNGNASVDHHLH